MKIVRIIKDGFIECAPFNWGLILFCYGCNLNCEMCQGYNYEYVTDQKNILGNSIEAIKSNLTPAHDCVVFLGGEPLIYGDTLIESLEFCKSLGLKTKIFTNGLNHGTVNKINSLKLCDSWSVDFKCLRKCGIILGKDITDKNYVDRVENSLGNIIKHDIPLEIRTTVTRLNVDQIADIQRECSKYAAKHIIQKDYRERIR